MYKSNLYRYNESSEEQDSSDDQRISPAFAKSAVFNAKQQPLIKSGGLENKNQELGNQEEEQSHLRPKLKIEKQERYNKQEDAKQDKGNKIMQNVSGLMAMKKHSVSQANVLKKVVNAAYTFKLKASNQTRKKNDPVALFQQTSTSWKKDKFLTSRADLKQGRKLQLQKRNKQ